RSQQEVGAYDDAYASYTALAERYPSARAAGEARWRSGWVRYLAGDYPAAAKVFGRLAGESERETRIAAEYWEARALDKVGDPEAQTKLVHIAQEHGESFYGVLASVRLGTAAPPPDTSGLEARLPPFPAPLTGPPPTRRRGVAHAWPGGGRAGRPRALGVGGVSGPGVRRRGCPGAGAPTRSRLHRHRAAVSLPPRLLGGRPPPRRGPRPRSAAGGRPHQTG